MKKRKLKRFVLPTLYLLITLSIFIGIIFISESIVLKEKDYTYSQDILEDIVESVIVEDTIVSNKINAPVLDGDATIKVHFYSKDDSEEKQQNSLIYYENTYLPNTGILYTSDNEFKVKTVFAGTITDILDDEFFGKCLVIEHTNNLRTYYYGLTNIELNVGDEVDNDTELGISNNNTLVNDKKSFLFEVYYNNELLNPETFIGTKISDYN